MAKMFPDINKHRIVFASRAEEQFYNLCLETLGGSWIIFYSCTLSNVEQGEGLKDNEIDFVLYHPRYGLVVIEVKGGRIRYEKDSNNFFSINRHGESFSIKNPFQQALVWKSRIVRVLKTMDIRVPVTHAVCFPNVEEAEFPKVAGIEPELILGRKRLADLETSLKTLVNRAQPEKYLRFEDVAAKIEKLLVGVDFSTKLYLRDYIDSHELRVKDIEHLHESLITPVASSKRLGIEGEAGTGKTILALQLAKHFRDKGLDVLLLSSNALLNLFLKQEAGANVMVQTYEEQAHSYGIDLLNPPEKYAGTAEDWIQFEAPDRLAKAVEAAKQRFDVILCDEAQDVQPFWWDVIQKLLRHQEESRFYIFFDRSQGVFGSGVGDKKFIPEEVIPIPAPYFPLVNNYRTTSEIATFARPFRSGKQILQSHSARLGYVPEIIYYENADDCRNILTRLMRKLIREEAMHPNEVTILSARKASADQSVIKGVDDIAGYPLHVLATAERKTWGESIAPNNKIPVSTVAGFKGLETSIGILLNVSEYNLPISNPLMSSLIYVACTRAKHMLYVFVQKRDPKAQAFADALKEVKPAGAVVLEGGVSDYEFMGKVIHYNPDRIGWLSVEDPSFPKSTVMFFPTDVEKANLAKLKIGDKIRFRPRIEGQATIACDLKMS